MKKNIIIILAIILIATFSISKANIGKLSNSGNDNTIKIGISQMIEHEALDLIYKGTVDKLA